MGRTKNPRLQALTAEAAAEQPPPNDAAEQSSPNDQTSEAPHDDISGLVEFCRVPVMLAGGALCGGYGVTPLAPSEIDRLAAALAGVMVANGVTIRDPRIMSAMVLGGTIAHVAAPRILEYRAAQAKAREDIERSRVTEPEPAANAKAA